ncbi:MAG: dTMP kinase [Rhodocyclaceae bacterium]|nr:dTMP kinase [Rhodocyclaceae bacterium]
MKQGRLITFEGVDGAGKSTQLERAVAWLRARGVDTLATREPGGTPLGEALRELLLHQPMRLETETLLMFAARAEHIAELIKPALAAGRWVVCDRFTDASFAYQGGGRGLAAARIADLERWVHADLQPDLTLIFDLAPEIAAQRRGAARATADRFEREQREFFDRVRAAYHQRAHAYPQRVRLIDASGTPDATWRQVEAQLDAQFA